MITPSARPRWDCAEWFTGNSEGFTYSPLFRLTLNDSVAMALVKHGVGHASARLIRPVEPADKRGISPEA